MLHVPNTCAPGDLFFSDNRGTVLCGRVFNAASGVGRGNGGCGCATRSWSAPVSTVERVLDGPAGLRPALDESTRAPLELRAPSGRGGRGWLVRRALALADVIGLVLAFTFATLFFAGRGAADNPVGGVAEGVFFLVTLPAWIVVANLYGLYRNDEERTDHSSADDLVGVFHLVTVGSWFVFLAGQVIGVAHPSVQRLIAFWITAIVLVTTARVLARAACRRTDVYLQNTVIVGAGSVGQLVASKLAKHPEYGLNVLGFVDAEPRHATERRNGNGGTRARLAGQSSPRSSGLSTSNG